MGNRITHSYNNHNSYQNPAIGLKRIKNSDRLESEPLEFHIRVRDEYLQLAAQDPERYLVVNAEQDISKIHSEITERILKYLKQK